MTPIQEAREALDRASRDVLEIPIPSGKDHRALADAVRSMFYATTRLVLLVRQNLHLARVAGDAEAAYAADRATWAGRARAALLLLQELERRAEKSFPGLRPPTPPDRHNSRVWLLSLARFDEIIGKLLAAPPTEDLPKGDADDLRDILHAVLTSRDPTYTDKAVDAMKGALDECRQELRHVQRAQLLLRRSHPGAFWQWLASLNDAANPAPGTTAAMMADSQLWRGKLGPIFKLLHKPGSSEWPVDLNSPDWPNDLRSFEWPKVVSFAELLKTRLPAVVTDFHARLGRRATISSVLQRYARRCRRLRLQELTALLKGLRATDKRELVLTRDAALYLFDQGFEVLIEQAMGSHRYDIIGEPLLVEAKIYDGRRRGLAAVVEGLSQIHQYANDLADEGVHGDPVLLVFRLGGPRATPVPEYKIGNLRVTIAHVDLGGSPDSGSNAPPPEPDITADDITAALERKGRRPGGKPKRRRSG
jgi:hypothetical protein